MPHAADKHREMSAAGYDLEPVLRAVARTTAACLGFRTTVINLHRPAWDDFQTVVVEGSDEARDALLGPDLHHGRLGAAARSSASSAAART